MDQNLNWKFDISTFRLLGRELITDRITALVELVKNSYDANAKNVYIEFIDSSDPTIGKIIIKDDGFGMSSDDIKSKWMTIGTDSKRKTKYTPEPFKRRVVGEKGVGRFALDKLGSDCKIYTKKQESTNLKLLIIDWSTYENNNVTDDFNLVNNKLKTKRFISDCSGVKLQIKSLHDFWTENDINRVYKEMSKIVSPFNSLYPPFNIYIRSNESKTYSTFKLVTNEVIKYATETIEITFNEQEQTQELIKSSDGKLIVQSESLKLFGPIKFRLYYFDQYAKGNFTKNYKGAELQIDGIRIYRDGILTTPFAEDQSHPTQTRDILGIDKRRWSGFFDKVSSRDLIGVVEITKELSPHIVDSTNRQDFIDNQAYRDLKEFIIEQLIELEKHLKTTKKSQYEKYNKNLEEARDKIGGFTEELKELKKDISENKKIDVNKKIKDLEGSARQAGIALKQGLKKDKEKDKEFSRKESMYMSLMSLQTYAMEITHIIKTSLGHIKRRAEFNNKYYDSSQYKENITKYNEEIIIEIDKLTSAIEFMSTYTRSEKNWENFDVKKSIHSVFSSYHPIFDKHAIQTIVEVESNITLFYNSVLFDDILKNLINNAVKSIEHLESKIIKVSAFTQGTDLVLVFSDNGNGIPNKDWERIYEIYFTTTSEDGGNGMGLYMVKTNLEAINGSIKVTNSELGNGATFELKFPFKRD